MLTRPLQTSLYPESVVLESSAKLAAKACFDRKSKDHWLLTRIVFTHFNQDGSSRLLWTYLAYLKGWTRKLVLGVQRINWYIAVFTIQTIVKPKWQSMLLWVRLAVYAAHLIYKRKSAMQLTKWKPLNLHWLEIQIDSTMRVLHLYIYILWIVIGRCKCQRTIWPRRC